MPYATTIDPVHTARTLLQSLDLMQPGRWHHRVHGVLVTNWGTTVDLHDWSISWWDVAPAGEHAPLRTWSLPDGVSLAAVAAIASSLEDIRQHRS